MTQNRTPNNALHAPHAGDRDLSSIAADIAAVRRWAEQRSRNLLIPSARLEVTEFGGSISVALRDQAGFDVSIASLRLIDGRWHPYWRRFEGRWAKYSDHPFLTTKIPLLLIDEDADGSFWWGSRQGMSTARPDGRSSSNRSGGTDRHARFVNSTLAVAVSRAHTGTQNER